ncbi:MAG: hypothetical protein ACREAM_23835, partial [Blastocatellia bacterium]
MRVTAQGYWKQKGQKGQKRQNLFAAFALFAFFASINFPQRNVPGQKSPDIGFFALFASFVSPLHSCEAGRNFFALAPTKLLISCL